MAVPRHMRIVNGDFHPFAFCALSRKAGLLPQFRSGATGLLGSVSEGISLCRLQEEVARHGTFRLTQIPKAKRRIN
jgi:hypothetical protein